MMSMSLIVIRDMPQEELLARVRESLKRQPYRHGLPIVPAGLGVEIIPLQLDRVEPDIEDEP